MAWTSIIESGISSLPGQMYTSESKLRHNIYGGIFNGKQQQSFRN